MLRRTPVGDRRSCAPDFTLRIRGMTFNRALALLLGTSLLAAQASAQQRTVTGNVSRDDGIPLGGVSVIVKGTSQGTLTNNAGDFTIRAEIGQILQFRRIGYVPRERAVTADPVLRVQLINTATGLDRVVVTALGQQTAQRNLGTSQQTVDGGDVAQTGRENFVNSLQGRVAGVEVTSLILNHDPRCQLDQQQQPAADGH
jgi:CarboxypepD_reg-like domain